MSQRNTLVRSLHDLGGAAWFGGNLMGAIGLNGAAATAKDPTERLAIASAGWARWAPVAWAGIIAHGVGGIGLIVGNKARLAGQQQGRSNTVVKAILTLGAVTTTIWSGAAGAVISKHAHDSTATTTEPNPSTPEPVKKAQRQQKILQWLTPILVGTVLVLGSQQGEQQRPLAGLLHKH